MAEKSEHPEAVRARERRKQAKGGRQAPSAGEIRQRLRESISELASALEDRDPELARVLKRDGPKMAELLGKWGEHPKTPTPVKVAVVVVAEILEPLRAFGGTVRLLLRRFRERRLEHARELGDDKAGSGAGPAEPEPVYDVVPVDEPAPVERGTPERFRVE